MLRILLIVGLVLVVLVAGFYFAIQQQSVQTFLAQRATDMLSNSLDTKVSIERVKIKFFTRAELVNFYMEDHQMDAMIYTKRLEVSFSAFELFNKKIKVKSLLLDGGQLFLHKDSLSGKLNIEELFSSFQSKQNKKDTTSGGVKWDVDLDEANLSRVSFRYLDDQAGSDVVVHIGKAEIAVNQIDLKKKWIDIHSLHFDSVQVAMGQMKYKKEKVDSVNAIHFLKDGLKIKYDELLITNSSFRIDDLRNDSILPKGIDFKHLHVTDIYLLAKDGLVDADTITTSIRRLSAKERSGFTLESLSTEARISVNGLTFDKLNIKTPNSEIKNYLSFRFQEFNDFGDFLNKVRIKTQLKGTKFSLKDLNYFLRTLDAVEHNRLYISGEIDGRVNNLKGRGIEIRMGNSTFFQGNFYTRGLPDIYETSLNLRVDRLATTADDLKRIFPKLKTPDNLQTLGLIYYSGSLDGFVTDFVSTGKLVTSIGNATTDVNFKYNPKKNRASYRGDLALNEFDLGKYFRDEVNLGKVSLKGKMTGVGLTLESLRDSIDGQISSIQFRGHDYRDILISGLVVQKSFSGTLKIRDEYLDMDFNGKAVLTDSMPNYDFKATVRKAMLQPLNLSKANISVAGQMDANIEGNNFDNLNGKINLSDVKLTRDDLQAEVKKILIEATSGNGRQKKLTLDADFAEAEIEGHFNFSELPGVFKGFVNSVFPNVFDNIPDNTSVQDFKADIRIYDPQELPQIFSPSFKKIIQTQVNLDFNSSTNHFKSNGRLTEAEWNGYRIKGMNLNTQSDNGVFDFNVSVDKIYNKDSLIIDTLNVFAKTEEKNIRCGLLVRDKNNYNYADMLAFITPYSDGVTLRLDPSDIKLGNYHWYFNSENLIKIQGKKITTNNLVFRTEEQKVFINSYLKNDTSTSIKIILDNTDLGDFTGIFTSKMKDLKGAMNGKLAIEDVFYKPTVYADLVVDEFTLGDELVGDVNIEMKLDSSSKKIWVNSSVKSVNNNIDIDGYVSIDPERPDIQLKMDASRIGLNFLNYPFFDKYVKGCRGYVTAKLQVKGTVSKPILTGSVLLVDDTVTVAYLNTAYRVKNQRVILDEHGFNLNGITVYDMKNAPIVAEGRINHESFRDFALDLYVDVRERAQFLNTTAKQSPNFYGIAYGTGNIRFSGLINNPEIVANAETGLGTYCGLPINSSFETNRYTFYRFEDTKHSNQPALADKKPKLNGLDFTLNLTATPDARLDIILDPVAGDMLTTYGTGTIKIHIPRNGNTAIYGDYEVSRGNYLFTLQSVVNKRFELNSGGTIKFNGEVYKAGLNLNAVYDVRSSVSDLIDDLINNDVQLTNVARGRIPVKLLLNLTGPLEQPNIGFDIRVMDADLAIRGYVEQKLMLLKNNPAELNKQVFGLLVMNKFLPGSSSASSFIGTPSGLGGTAANTVSEFLSSQLSNYLGDLLSYTGNSDLSNLSINLNYRQYDPTSSTSTTGGIDTRRELQLALSQRLLNNRLSINAGGNLDFGNNPSGVERNVIPTGDFQIEYSLTPDGRWKAKAYNRTNYDYFNSRNSNRTGIGIAYRREFDNPADLFKRRKLLKTKAVPVDNVNIPPPVLNDSSIISP
ncbi:MAG: translocation/assembly module TamB domain-containing protein [Bacteroidetes bacterium]|nr:translocation/assembly module TamB domain-containing protein [Bacteroidota bacterium]